MSEPCPRAGSPAWSAFVDGELSPAERAAHEAHLAECAACEAFVRGLRATVARLASTGIAPPPAVWEAVRVEIGRDRSSGETRSRSSFARRAAAGLAVAAAMIAFVIGVRSRAPIGSDQSVAVEVDSIATRAMRDVLVSLDQAIAAAEGALARHPGDTYLIQVVETARREREAALSRAATVLARVR